MSFFKKKTTIQKILLILRKLNKGSYEIFLWDYFDPPFSFVWK